MFRDLYDGEEARKVSDETALACLDKSLCRRSDQDSADINVLMERMKVGYEVPVNVRPPEYSDFTNALDFAESMNAIRAAQVSFGAMPAKVRERFMNDPQRFLEFCEERDFEGKRVNYDEMVRLGLAVAPEAPSEPPIVNVRVVPDPAAGAV